ncbi:MAG: hypothetical protein ABIZ34_06365, partial [Candidatus Limnocylindrales bacterium]
MTPLHVPVVTMAPRNRCTSWRGAKPDPLSLPPDQVIGGGSFSYWVSPRRGCFQSGVEGAVPSMRISTDRARPACPTASVEVTSSVVGSAPLFQS